MTLTPSLPWCHLKTTSKSAKFETLKASRFHTNTWKDFFYQMHSAESRCVKTVIGPKNVLSTAVLERPCIIQPRNSTGWGSERVKLVLLMY